MLASKLYSPTLREIPSDAVVVSHQYMLKAGMMRKVSNGLYAFLPLALRSVLALPTKNWLRCWQRWILLLIISFRFLCTRFRINTAMKSVPALG